MLIAYWIVAGLLALAMLASGGMKVIKPKTAIVEGGMGWAEDFAPGMIKFIGIAEVLGALGLVLPVLTGVAPVLAPIAAVALAVVMIGAVVVHVRRKEPAAPALVLAAVSVAAAVLGFLAVA